MDECKPLPPTSTTSLMSALISLLYGRRLRLKAKYDIQRQAHVRKQFGLVFTDLPTFTLM